VELLSHPVPVPAAPSCPRCTNEADGAVFGTEAQLLQAFDEAVAALPVCNLKTALVRRKKKLSDLLQEYVYSCLA